jgi:hypothetical protein
MDREFMDPAPKTSITPFPSAAYEHGPVPIREWRTPVVAAVDSPLPVNPAAAKVQPVPAVVAKSR